MPGRAAASLASVPQHRRWWVLGAVVALQTIALYLPGVHGPATGLPLDKITHFLIFTVVAAVAVWVGVPWPLVAVLLLGQAAASELVQHFVLSDRAGEWGDVVADAVGIAAGIATGLTVADRPRRG